MSKMLKGIILDPEKKNIYISSFELKNVSTFYEMLRCEYVDIVTRKISGINVTIVCDDSGALKKDKKPSVVGVTKRDSDLWLTEIIFEKIFICDVNQEGDLKSLSINKINKVLKSMSKIEWIKDIYPVLISTF